MFFVDEAVDPLGSTRPARILPFFTSHSGKLPLQSPLFATLIFRPSSRSVPIMREQLSSGDMCGARIARSVAVGRRSGNGEWKTERPFGRYGRKSRRRARIRTPQKNSTVVLSLQSKVENGPDHETLIFVDPSHEDSIFAACHMNLCKKYICFPPIIWEVPRCARARAGLLRHLTLISDLGLRTRTYAHPFAEPASTARLDSCSLAQRCMKSGHGDDFLLTNPFCLIFGGLMMATALCLGSMTTLGSRHPVHHFDTWFPLFRAHTSVPHPGPHSPNHSAMPE